VVRTIVSVFLLVLVQAGISPCATGETKPALSFSKAVGLVLEQSKQIQLADEELEAARRAYKGAVRALYPRLWAQAMVSGDLFEYKDFFDDRNLGTSLVLEWNFFQNGQLRFRIHQARVTLEVAELRRDQRTTDIAYETRELYYNILKGKGALHISEKELELERKRMELIRRQFEQGTAEESQVREKQAAFFERQLIHTRKQQAYEMQFMRLSELTGLEEIIDVADVERRFDTELEPTPQPFIQAAYHNCTEVLIQTELTKLAEKGAKFSRLKRLPQVRVFTSSDYQLQDPSGIEDLAFRAGMAVSYPIYDAGSTRREIQAAESNFRQAKIQFSIAKAKAEFDVKEAYWNYMNNLKLYQIADERKLLGEKDYQRSKRELQSGKLSQTEYEEAELYFLKSCQTVKDIELDVMLAREKLLKVVGVNSMADIQTAAGQSMSASSENRSKEVKN